MTRGRMRAQASRRRRFFAVAISLTALLTVLVVLQARWLTQLADAQREEARRTLRTAAERIAADFQEALAEVDASVRAVGVANAARSLDAVLSCEPLDGASSEDGVSVVVDFGGERYSVGLDRRWLQGSLFPRLVERALGPEDLDIYRVVVSSIDDRVEPLYRSHPDAEALGPADVRVDLPFRANRWLGRVPGLDGTWTSDTSESERSVSSFGPDGGVLPVRLGGAGTSVFFSEDAPEVPIVLDPEPSRWRVEVRHHAGSLDLAWARTRTRNLLLAGGLLVLLLIGCGFLWVAEQRARRLAERELAFVAGMSHELRTPLAVMRSAASNLGQGLVESPDRVREYGALIETEVARVVDRVERVLRFSDRESTPAVREDVDLRAAIDDAVERCGPWRDRRRFHVAIDVSPDASLVRADRGAITALLHNLIENSVKYGGEAPEIAVTTRRRVVEGTRVVEIRVVDRGPGIDIQDRPHVFEPFYRSATVRDGSITGSGLGLSVARDIAREHGGTLTLEEGVASGSSFLLVLPQPVEAEE